MKTILKFYPNGNLESLVPITQSGITNDYKFKADSVIVPKIVKYPQPSLPWVKETGQPFSIFPNGIVIKGELIQPVTNLIFSDDFNRPNATFVGEPWQLISGVFSIENNVAMPKSSAYDNNLIAVDVGTQNFVSVTLGVLVPFATECLIFRFKDGNNYLRAMFDNGNLLVKLRKNGAASTIATMPYKAVQGIPYKMSVEIRDSEIKVYIDDELKLTTESKEFLDATKCGILSWSYANDVSVFDDFKVKAI